MFYQAVDGYVSHKKSLFTDNRILGVYTLKTAQFIRFGKSPNGIVCKFNAIGKQIEEKSYQMLKQRKCNNFYFVEKTV